ncbi:hypothetical protein HanRHA438_Chr06g0274081 [Helianthus annuus]|nr:hypothetical protein HanRHA438_Chr06g0274081 [Helianthus annuus]
MQNHNQTVILVRFFRVFCALRFFPVFLVRLNRFVQFCSPLQKTQNMQAD